MGGMLIDTKRYYQDVAEAIGKLAESNLRDSVLSSLLRELDYVDVRVLRGPREQGKDLLAWRMSEIDTPEWNGFVVKTGYPCQRKPLRKPRRCHERQDPRSARISLRNR